MNDITIHELSKSYGEKKVLERFSARLAAGRIHALMGPSGAGKTTLLRLLLQLEKPDNGEISGIREGKTVAVFQEDRLLESLTVGANLRLVLGKKADMALAEELMVSLGLEGSVTTPVSQLSGGMKRRVALARALAVPSDVLLLDEPFKGLDEATKQSVMSVCRSCFAGKTVLLVTHSEEEADFFQAERLYLPG